jgi:hypothetical protein
MGRGHAWHVSYPLSRHRAIAAFARRLVPVESSAAFAKQPPSGNEIAVSVNALRTDYADILRTTRCREIAN